MAELERVQMVNHLEPGLALEPINRGEIDEHVELETGFIAKRSQDFQGAIAGNDYGLFSVRFGRIDDIRAESFLYFFNQHAASFGDMGAAPGPG